MKSSRPGAPEVASCGLGSAPGKVRQGQRRWTRAYEGDETKVGMTSCAGSLAA